MGKVNDQKRSEFLENDKIKQLGKVVVGKVNSYRELNDKIIETESEIETLQGNLKRMRNDLINQNQYFDDLRKKYSFGCSISQRKGTRSFNFSHPSKRNSRIGKPVKGFRSVMEVRSRCKLSSGISFRGERSCILVPLRCK